MNLLKKWQKRDEGESGRHRDEGGLSTRGRDYGASLRREMDRMFDRIWRDPFSAEPLGELTNWPPVDINENDKSITIRADVPGLEGKDLDVEVAGNQLTIRGQRNDEWADNKGGVQRRERVSGSFSRTFTLPAYADPSQVQARYEKGTLTLTVPKQPGQGPKKVQVSG